MTMEEVNDIPCGFPIVTEKRSSSSFKLPTCISDEKTLVQTNGSTLSNNGHASVSFSDGISNGSDETREAASLPSFPYGHTFRKTITIRNEPSLVNGDHHENEELGAPIRLTAMDTDSEQNFVAIMAICYHDTVERTYQQLNVESQENGHQERGSDTKTEEVGRNRKILGTTTITTVADVYIHISLASEPFIGSNADANNSSKDTHSRLHQITLSATTSTEEIDETVINESIEEKKFGDSYRYRYAMSDVQPQITFSSNAKYLACIIPRPIRERDTDENESDNESECGSISSMVYIQPARISNLAIFHLEPQTIEYENDIDSKGTSINDVWSELPQPTYLRANESYSEAQQGDANDKHTRRKKRNSLLLPPIATNPHTATLDPLKISGDDITVHLARLLSQITCLCDLNHNSVSPPTIQKTNNNGTLASVPLLLVGCTNGSILVVSYKKATVLGMLHHGHERGNARARPISAANQAMSLNNIPSARNQKAVDHCTWDDRSTGLRVLNYHVNERDGQDLKGMIRGRILGVQRDGQVAMFSTSFRSKSMAANIKRDEQGQDKGTLSDYGNSLIWESKKFAFVMTAKPMKGLYANSASSSLTTRRYANSTFIDFNTFATLVRPLYSCRGQGRDIKFDDLVAQVWSVNESRLGGAKLISEFSLNYEKLEEIQHGFFGNKSDSSSLPVYFGLSVPTSIEYDEITGCLLIASAIPVSRSTKTAYVEAKAFVSLWDWKSSTVGLTLASAQKLHFSTRRSGPCGANPIFFAHEILVSTQRIQREAGTVSLVHTFGGSDGFQNDVYRVGVLSPSRCRKSCRGLDDENPVFLSKDYVMYPSLLQSTVGKEIQVEWKRSIVPQSYTMKNGPIVIATICGKFGSSLAAIGSRGLCVLDIHRENGLIENNIKDRRHAQYSTSCVEGFQCEVNNFQFKSKHDRWRMFQRRDEQSFTVMAMVWWEDFYGSNEDVLVAVVKYVDESDPCHYLVAWSSRRLEMGKFQLIDDIENNLRHTNKGNRGLCLPQDFISGNISILIQESGARNDHAVISIAGTMYGAPYHSIIRLQVSEGDGNNQLDRVLAHRVAAGAIPVVTSRTDYVFLASCSYHFDLKDANIAETRTIATIGIIHDHGVSLSAVAIEKEGTHQCAKIADLRSKPTDANQITKVWLNDFSPSSSAHSCTFTWSFMKSNGTLFSWALGDHLLPPDGESLRFALHQRVFTDPIEQNDTSACPNVFGVKSNERRSLKGSITDERTILLGALPSTDHQHLLYSGQTASIGYRCDNSFSKCALYGVANFDIGIPSSTASTLLALSMIAECQLTEQQQIAEQMTVQIIYRIQKMHNSETTFAELRSIISFLTELVSRKERRNAVDEIERKRFLKATQGVLVRIAISALIQVQFISLFLNVGRQLEPHHFKSLFPLSLSIDAMHSDQVLSLQDLFDMAVDDGSFSVPGAALPLFTNKKIVHSLCVNLLHHCIHKILRFNDANHLDIKSLREECLSVHQLYSYIIKVEDSERLLQSSLLSTSFGGSESSHQSDESDEYDFDESLAYEELSSGEFSFIDSVTGTSYDDHISQKHNLKPSGRFSALASRLIKPLITSKEKRNENAISDAASSFILSNYKKNTQDSDSFLSESASDSSISTDDEGDITAYFENEELAAFSACGVVGMAIVSSIFLVHDASPDTIAGALRNISGLCLLLRSDVELSSTISLIKSTVVTDLVTSLSVDDVLNSMLILENMIARNEHSVTIDSQETAVMATAFMEVLLYQGSKEWNKERAEAVGEVVANILARHENSPEIITLSPLLSMLMIVACHVAKQSLPFSDTDESDCALAELYHACLEGMEEQVNGSTES